MMMMIGILTPLLVVGFIVMSILEEKNETKESKKIIAMNKSRLIILLIAMKTTEKTNDILFYCYKSLLNNKVNPLNDVQIKIV